MGDEVRSRSISPDSHFNSFQFAASRMTQESYRPGVSDRTMVGNSATIFAYEFQRTERRRHDSEHETTGMEKKDSGLVTPRTLRDESKRSSS